MFVIKTYFSSVKKTIANNMLVITIPSLSVKKGYRKKYVLYDGHFYSTQRYFYPNHILAAHYINCLNVFLLFVYACEFLI